MPALVGPFVALALGVALAWLGRAEAPREDEASFRARLAVVAMFGALVFAPACAYFIVFAGDWALFYLADSRDVPSALELLLVLADAVLPAVGFLAGHHAARRRAVRALAALAIAPATIAAGLVVAFLGRVRVDGTFHQVTSRFGTQPIAGSPLGWAVLWMGAMIVAAFVIAARILAGHAWSGPVSLARPPGPRPSPPPAPGPRQPLLGRRRSP